MCTFFGEKFEDIRAGFIADCFFDTLFYYCKFGGVYFFGETLRYEWNL